MYLNEGKGLEINRSVYIVCRLYIQYNLVYLASTKVAPGCTVCTQYLSTHHKIIMLCTHHTRHQKYVSKNIISK